MHELSTSSQTKKSPKITNKQLALLLPQYISKVAQQKIETRSGLKFEKVIFDGEKDDFSPNTSVFGEKINQIENLCYIIQSENNNTFGGVICNQINVDPDEDYFLKDDKAFVFNLNGEQSDRYIEGGDIIKFSCVVGSIKNEDYFLGCVDMLFVLVKK
ncbi:hypothetical protein EIN_320820 [Entamoeba invadens IP1]|uniref:TLDc domain-containing protein n=1 Tax=Entamoeba invadens IP1 TaxID=370355 RepID=A0A0A1UCR7_ENTIV|nr:hypothetical protein EIN_320820 [Entamoeba invadens IP1]ELP93719.1 hypothetical protein EIN_320820 [Entamoeba invadens IP1]|eukprot:XP_004260490.1 hypothetical protein EIN_320820 [Entamoeba invadens IP1]